MLTGIVETLFTFPTIVIFAGVALSTTKETGRICVPESDVREATSEPFSRTERILFTNASIPEPVTFGVISSWRILSGTPVVTRHAKSVTLFVPGATV